MKVVKTKKAPAAIGPYSQGMISGNLCFCSGQIPVNPETGDVPEGIEKQAEQTCKNVEQILIASGTSMEKVIKTTCFIPDTKDLHETYEFFKTIGIENIIYK